MNNSRTTPSGWVAHWLIATVGLCLTVVLAGCATPPGGATDSLNAIYAHAEGVRADRLDARQARDAAIFAWAAELKVAEPFSSSDIERAYSDATSKQAAGVAPKNGEYGAQTMTLWDFYLNQVESRAQLIKSTLGKQQSMEDVREYYLAHQDSFSRQDPITVKVTEWADGRALSSREVAIDAATVRLLQEEDDVVISAALELEPGQQKMVERGHGKFAQLDCLTRTDGGFEPFDSVVQAASSQLANQRFDDELKRRTASGS